MKLNFPGVTEEAHLKSQKVSSMYTQLPTDEIRNEVIKKSLDTKTEIALKTCRSFLSGFETTPSHAKHGILRKACEEMAPNANFHNPDNSEGESGETDSGSLILAKANLAIASHPISLALVRRGVAGIRVICRPDRFGKLIKVVPTGSPGECVELYAYRIPDYTNFDHEYFVGIIQREIATYAIWWIQPRSSRANDYLDSYKKSFEYELGLSQSRHNQKIELVWPATWRHELIELAGLYLTHKNASSITFRSESQEERWSLTCAIMHEIAFALRLSLK